MLDRRETRRSMWSLITINAQALSRWSMILKKMNEKCCNSELPGTQVLSWENDVQEHGPWTWCICVVASKRTSKNHCICWTVTELSACLRLGTDVVAAIVGWYSLTAATYSACFIGSKMKLLFWPNMTDYPSKLLFCLKWVNEGYSYVLKRQILGTTLKITRI